jgi:hypothetical protein
MPVRMSSLFLSPDIVLSAAEDGRVRRMDAREAAPPRSATRVAVEDFNARSLLGRVLEDTLFACMWW